MAGRGAAIAGALWLSMVGGPACSVNLPPAAPPPTIVDTTLPLPRTEPAARMAAAPRRKGGTVDAQVVPPADRIAAADKAEADKAEADKAEADKAEADKAEAAVPASAARPLSESDPFRTDSLDGNRFGRKLVKQILRPPGQEPSESAATAPTDEP